MALKYKTTAIDPEATLAALVKAHARDVTAGVAALTDSSGGTPGTLTKASVALANAANSGTNLAGKATTDAALVTVTDALKELFTKANEYATKLGLDNITYSGGGAAADGTVAAVTVSVTAAATGVQATEMNTAFGDINEATYVLANLVNGIARAQGVAELANFTGITHINTIPAITVSGGTAADPGVTKAAVDAELVKVRNNVATIASKLNALNDGLGNALVVLV